MPRPATYKLNELLDLIAPVFRDRGYADATMSALSNASGLSKASLYHHFPDGKPEMGRKILGLEGQRMHAAVLDPLSAGDKPLDQLRSSLQGVLIFYSGPVPACMMNSLMLGEGVGLFRADIAAAVLVWQRGLEKCYERLTEDSDEAKAWAQYAIERIQGALILCKVTASRMPLERAVQELIGDIELL